MFEPKNNPQKRVTLRELVADHQVFAPCIWDVFSARAAEQAGFEATFRRRTLWLLPRPAGYWPDDGG